MNTDLELALRPGVKKLIPNVLLPVQFQNRFPLTWNPDYLNTVAEDYELQVSLQKIVKALIEKYPSAQTHGDILAKVALHANAFCPNWFMLERGQPLHMYLPPEAQSRQSHATMIHGDNILGEIEVSAQADEFGTARYTCRNYYQTNIEITEELVQEAIDQDPDDPVGYLLNLIQSQDVRVDVTETNGRSEDYEYDDHDYIESDHFQTTNDRNIIEQLLNIVEEYQANTGYGADNNDDD
jgi:hypothetical protein